MNRRSVILNGSATLSALIAGCHGARNGSKAPSAGGDGRTSDENATSGNEQNEGAEVPADDEFDSKEIDSQSFQGSGNEILHDPVIADGLTVFDLAHDGCSRFCVSLYRGMNDAGFEFVDSNGHYEGEISHLHGGGWIDITADGRWQLEIRHPRATSGGRPPRLLEGRHSRVAGPFDFDNTHSVRATYHGKSEFNVRAVSVARTIAVAFDETGEYEGTTTLHTDRIGWIAVEADDAWSLELR